jgi:outer membrane protein assembly factor BamB
MRITLPTLLALLIAIHASTLPGSEWSQFRGPNGSGTVADSNRLPTQFQGESDLLWRCELTRGLSSPCVRQGRIFLTEFDTDASELSVVCVARTSGSVLWRKAVPAEEIEKVHKVSSPANATVAADDERIYVYFASCGLFCFDHTGEEVWDYAMPVSKRLNGSGTSPVVVDNRVLLNREDNQEKYLLALDAKTGKEVWKQPHGSLLSLFTGGGPTMGEATPILWKDQIILHRHNEVAGFAIDDGKRQWSMAIRTTAASTPVVDGDVLYVAAWNNFGEPDLQGKLPKFDSLVKRHDKNDDSMLTRDELPWGPALSQRPELAGRGLGGNISVKLMFNTVDSNRDGNIDSQEWDYAAGMSKMMMAGSKHGMTAIRLAKDDGRVKPEQLWQVNKSVPEVPSPLVVGDHIYMIKNGGILTCLQKTSGEVVYRRRLQSAGPYYASLVAAGGLILAASGDGVLSVFQSGEDFELVVSHDFGETIFATPALVDGVLYVRTDNALYAFAEHP